MIQPSVFSSRMTWDRNRDVARGAVVFAMTVAFASFATACETNACLPSTTCVNGPQYSETFLAAPPIADATAGDAAGDASVDSGLPDGTEPSESSADAESVDEASDP
jgi:hypothetical protein